MVSFDTLGPIVDPRVRRTRVLLFEALQALLLEKDFEKISVQDIAGKATLNRATFYDHYPDKFALLESMIEERFVGLVAKRGLGFDGCADALRGIALSVCEFLTEIPCRARDKHSLLEMHAQMAMIKTIRAMILAGLRKHAPGDDAARALTATAVAWAVCGAANEWAQTSDRCPAEAIADAISQLVAPLFAPFGARAIAN